MRVVRSSEELGEAVETILGLTIKGKPVSAVLLEEGAAVQRELYLAITLDRHAKSPLLIFSTRGGMDIEQVATDDPAALLRLPLQAASETCDDACRRVVAAAGLSDPGLDEALADLVRRLWALYRERDASLLEINPLAVVDDPARLVALDAKVTIDDSALYRQPDLAALRPDEDARERAAREAGVTYLTLDGNVGVLGNGAGLVMSTLDMIGAAGGAAADFCDIGGGARAERIAAALDIITGDERMRALLINIFGGITRGDEVARGVLAWTATQQRPAARRAARRQQRRRGAGASCRGRARRPRRHAERPGGGRSRGRGRGGEGGAGMSILVDGASRVLVQGMTGREGSFHTERMLAAGAAVVAGVTPGKGGRIACGLPVFDDVGEAVSATGADVSVIFVPARFAKAAVLQAAAGGVRVAVLITEGIPVRDMSEVVAELGLDEGPVAGRPFVLIGPNCPASSPRGAATPASWRRRCSRPAQSASSRAAGH